MNVGQGNVRRKALVQQLAQQAAQKMQQKNAFSRFSQTGTDMVGNRLGRRPGMLPFGRSQTPGLGGGIHATAGGGTGLNFSDAYRRQNDATQQGRQDVAGPDQSFGPGIPAGLFPPPVSPPSGQGSPFVGDQASQGMTTAPPYVGGPAATGASTPQTYLGGPAPMAGQTSPSALIPLGNGVYFNPDTGLLHGSGLPAAGSAIDSRSFRWF
jgi:hypothetical protein